MKTNSWTAVIILCIFMLNCASSVTSKEYNDDNKENNNVFKFKLEYLIFGSKQSIDLDVAVKFPTEIIDKLATKTNKKTLALQICCEQLDEQLNKIFGKNKCCP